MLILIYQYHHLDVTDHALGQKVHMWNQCQLYQKNLIQTLHILHLSLYHAIDRDHMTYHKDTTLANVLAYQLKTNLNANNHLADVADHLQDKKKKRLALLFLHHLQKLLLLHHLLHLDLNLNNSG